MNSDEIAYGVEIPGLYDGVAYWVMKDGSRVNRWAGIEGYERRAAAVQKVMDANGRAGREEW